MKSISSGNELSRPDAMALAAVCRRFRIHRLALFGSRLGQSARTDSDVDLLVEFEPTAAPTYLDMAEAEAELSPLYGGKRVDLRTARELSRYFRDQVARDALEQYVAQ